MSSTANMTRCRPSVLGGGLCGLAPIAAGVWYFVSSSLLWPSGVRIIAMSLRTPPSSKVRRAPILCLASHCLDYAPGRTLRRDYRDLVEPGRTQQLPVLLAGALLPATEKHQHVEVHQGETRPLGRIRIVLRG